MTAPRSAGDALRALAQRSRKARESLGDGCPELALPIYPERAESIARVLDAADALHKWHPMVHSMGQLGQGDELSKRKKAYDAARRDLMRALEGPDCGGTGRKRDDADAGETPRPRRG